MEDPWTSMRSAARRWAASVEDRCSDAASEAGVARVAMLRSLLLEGSPEEVRLLDLAVRLGAFGATPDGPAARAAVQAALARKSAAVPPRLESALKALVASGPRPAARSVAGLLLLLDSTADRLALALDLDPPADRPALRKRLVAALRGRGARASRRPARAAAASTADAATSGSDDDARIGVVLAGCIARSPSCRLSLGDLSRLAVDQGRLFAQIPPEAILLPVDADAIARAVSLRRSGEESFRTAVLAAVSADSPFAERAAAWERIAEVVAVTEAAAFIGIPIVRWLRNLKLPERVDPEGAPESVRRSLAGRRGEAAEILRALAEPRGARWRLLGRWTQGGQASASHPWARALHDDDAVEAFACSSSAAQRRELFRSLPALHARFAESVARCAGLGLDDLGLLVELAGTYEGRAAVEAIAADQVLRDAAIAGPRALRWLERAATWNRRSLAPIVEAIPLATWRRWCRSKDFSTRLAVRWIATSKAGSTARFVETMLAAGEFGILLDVAGSAMSPTEFERVLRAWHAAGAAPRHGSALRGAQASDEDRPRWLALAAADSEPASETVDALLALGLTGSTEDLTSLVASAPDRFLPVVRTLLGDAPTVILASRRRELCTALDRLLGADARAALVGSFRRDGALKRLVRRLPKASRPGIPRRTISRLVAGLSLSRAEAIVLEVACLSAFAEVGFLSKCMRHSIAVADTKGIGSRFDHLYSTYERPKRKGGTRTITAPCRELKRFQRRLLEQGFGRVAQHDAVHGFVRGRGIASNAAVHVGQPLVVNVDVRAFFPSTSCQRVVEAARRLAGGRVAPGVALFVAELCCFRGALPTGAPTSPAIANLVLSRVDRALATRCARIGVRYTRYADDLTFSGDDRAKRIIPFVRSLLRELGYELDLSKTQLYRRGRQQIVTGLTVNDRVNVKRSDRRRLRAAVHARVAKGGATWFGRPMDDAALMGRIAMLHALDPSKAAAMRAQLARVVGSKKSRRKVKRG